MTVFFDGDENYEDSDEESTEESPDTDQEAIDTEGGGGMVDQEDK
jgi:hypothetical protein